MKLLSHIPAWLRNKYFIAFAAFTIMLLFFDRNDLFIQWNRTGQLNELKQSKKYYEEKIAKERAELERLKSNPAAIEQYAREKYHMKKDNEDLFIIQEP
jgi:cell division protein DivIC